MSKKTILLVDDEDIIRDMLVDALSDDFDTLSARNGEDALHLYKQYQEKIFLVITDLMMPKMRGDALAEELRKIHPSIPIVFISGYQGDIQTSELLTKGHAKFIQKPFDIERLTSTLRELLV